MAVLNKYQFVFRKNKSTSQAVFKIMTDLFKAIDNKEITHMVNIDYWKAFDTKDHTILIQKSMNITISVKHR